MPTLIDNFGLHGFRVMIFVDGENLAIRFGCHLRDNPMQKPRADLLYSPGEYVWWRPLSGTVALGGAVLRTHYYTSVQGDQTAQDHAFEELKNGGVEAPRIFKKIKDRSKGVDIALTTEMLHHATRGHYDIGVLVSGDGDYAPLLQAVKSEGRGVHVWSVSSGLSPALVKEADEHVDLAPYFTGLK